MTSNEVLSMYENIAGLTTQMATAARAGDWNGLARLEDECATHAVTAETELPALHGEARQRKIDLLKQIMANDRVIREMTEPWMAQIANVMAPHRADH